MADEKDKDWFSEAAATFGDRVAGAREAAAMTQEQLAQTAWRASDRPCNHGKTIWPTRVPIGCR